MPKTAPSSSQSLSESGFGGAALELYKCDGRSRVWRVDGPGGMCVIKRFEYARWRQGLSRALGIHPAQREIRAYQKLNSVGIRVAPVVGAGVDGGRSWLATRWQGPSLQQVLRNTQGEDRRIAMVEAAVTVTRDLVAAGFTFKDLKPSNILIDHAGAAWLIDVGAVARGINQKKMSRMIAVMVRVMTRDGVEPELRQRFARAFQVPC